MNITINGGGLTRITRRFETLANITCTGTGEWSVEWSPGLVTATHICGAYVTLHGGEPSESPEFMLDQTGLCPSSKRRALATGTSGAGWSPGALAVLLVREWRDIQALRARRADNASKASP